MLVDKSKETVEEKRDIRFAVTAPWGVELEEDIVLVVNHDILVVVCNYNLDRSCLFFGNGFGLDAGFDIAVDELLDERGDLIMRD